jgi:hypothetical protein
LPRSRYRSTRGILSLISSPFTFARRQRSSGQSFRLRDGGRRGRGRRAKVAYVHDLF